MSALTPDDFIKKWKASELKESSAAQEHFIDLCHLLDEPTPADADKQGTFYCFERGATKATGGEGWADVWKRGHFGWEYKGKRKDLNAAFSQLQQYALALENPPLLVTCDMDRFVIRTNWTNSISRTYELALDDLRDAAARQILKAVLSDPERLRPGQTRADLTEKAAGEFAVLAKRLRDRGHEPHEVAHFINRLVFCMFAEDVGLLPNNMFSRMLAAAEKTPADFAPLAGQLFAAMRTGGMVGFERVEWFNGGLFDGNEALPLEADDIALCRRTADLDWSDVEPSILGTLFERGLDPDKRSQLGAHYTDRDKIMMIVEPVIVRPLLVEWAAAKEIIQLALARAENASSTAAKTRHRKAADDAYRGFLERVRAYRVLDPACGSGNFLYLALRALKDIEHRAGLEAEALGLQRPFPSVGPENVLGIEINPYAAELARVSIWIGEIQWMRRNGFDAGREPILRPLQTVMCADALVTDGGARRQWPPADVIIGNPPFLGAKLMRRILGTDYTLLVRQLFSHALPGFTDLVCYWFENAREAIESGRTTRAGLVATNSIRKNTNLPVLRRVAETTPISDAWPEERWTVEGAAVDVSLVCFGRAAESSALLAGNPVPRINPDLTSGSDLSSAAPLRENQGVAFLGIQKSGPFDVPGQLARQWMKEPCNPNGRHNSEVLKPYWNGDDVTGRPRDMWFIDLPLGLEKQGASLFASPFRHIAETPDAVGKLIAELRAELGERAGPRWWEPAWPRPEMRQQIRQLHRYIVTPETAQYRTFTWLSYPTLPDKNLIVIARDDDLMFGLLSSRFHQEWSLRKGSDLQDRPRYTHTSTFATFPFPAGMTPNLKIEEARAHPAAASIEAAACQLHHLRQSWLFPADWVIEEDEEPPSYIDRAFDPLREVQFPKRIGAAGGSSLPELRGRTLTNLYNSRPEWLREAHRALDEAVAAAYGWPASIDTDEALGRLLVLNQERSG